MLLNGADVLRAFGTPEAMRPILRNGTPTEGALRSQDNCRAR